MCIVVIFAIKKRLEFFQRFIYNLNIELHLKKVSFTEKVGQGVLQQVEMIGFIISIFNILLPSYFMWQIKKCQ